MNIIYFKKPAELRKWFVNNWDKLDEAWIGYYKKATKKESITWEESVQEAIAFGWIDGIRKSVDNESYKVRFTPRRKNSIWSLRNIKIAEELIKNDLMQAPGLASYKLRKEAKSGVYAFEQEKVSFSKEFETQFKANQKSWDFFNQQAPYYKKIVTHWVMSAKQEKTRIRRLNTLIEDSENHLKVKHLRKR